MNQVRREEAGGPVMLRSLWPRGNRPTKHRTADQHHTSMRRLIRSHFRHPGSTATAAVTGAAGIALFTLALALADAARWRPLPFPGGEDVVVLHASHTSPRDVRPEVGWSFPRLQFVRERAATVDLVTSWTPATLSLTGGDAAELVAAEFVSRDYFRLLGIVPRAGRTFAADEDVAGDWRAVAVVSEAFQARQRMAGVTADVGATIIVNAQPVTIVGVVPGHFTGISGSAMLWLPTPMAPVLTYPEYLTTPQDFITLLARRRPGRSLGEVQREVSLLSAASQQVQPTDDAAPDLQVSGSAEPLREARVRDEGWRAASLAVAGSALFLLLTIANLVALLLGRAVARRRETAVALAIGASRAHLWGVRAAEGAALALLAGIVALAGLALALLVIGPIDPLAIVGRSRFSTFSAVGLDGRLVGWWGAATALCVVGAATFPAWWSLRDASLDHLREGTHGSASAGVSLRRPGVAAGILAIESALAMLLIAAAGQLVESYRRLLRVDVGVEAEHVLTFELQPSDREVPPSQAPRFIDRVLAAVREVPGVRAASVDGGAPLAGSASAGLHVVGRPDDPVAGAPIVLRHYVGPEHFATLGIPLRAGRAFRDADRADAPRVAIISESVARQYFKGGDAIGQRLWFDGSTLTSPDSSAEVVGIVGDVPYDPLIRSRTMASVYTPYAQFTYGWRVYFVRVAGDPRAMMRPISEAVHGVAPDLPIRQMRPLEEIVSAANAVPGRAARATGLLAALGVLLAACGTWAVVSHAVAQRRRDMAIRVAHGATAERVMRLVLSEGLVWPAVGVVSGAGLAVAGSGVLRGLLYGVAPGDPVIVAAAAALLVAAALVACLLPAWSATRVSPMEALRAD
jgi:putative ABC transport system permease protein